jgi:hypothetical protein
MKYKRIPTSVRFLPEWHDQLREASESTGYSVSDLVEDCVKESLGRVVRRRLAERREKMGRYRPPKG